MKITKVETFLVRWGDVSPPAAAAFGAATAVVAIHAVGMVGLGGASPKRSGVAFFRSLHGGRDAFQLQPIASASGKHAIIVFGVSSLSASLS